MEVRRDVKREIIAIQTLLRTPDLKDEQRKTMSQYMKELRLKLDTTEAQLNREEIASRRTFLKENKGLLDIFNSFWSVFMVYTNDGFLSREGYSKFSNAMHIALLGQKTFETVDEKIINTEWTYDKLLYGALNKEAFFDLLFETIETWTEIVDPSFYAAFSWALLDSIADTTTQPPKLRPPREMTCIMKINNEAAMIKSYIETKKVRAALSITNEMMQRIPEVQRRLHDRRFGAGHFDEAQLTMIEALSLQAGSNVGDFSDSDADSVHSSYSLQPLAKPWIAQEEVDKALLAGGGLEADLDLDDGEVDEEEQRYIDAAKEQLHHQQSRLKQHQAQQSKSQYQMRTSTQSFLSYVQARRETQMQLNGGYLPSSPVGGGRGHKNVPLAGGLNTSSTLSSPGHSVGGGGLDLLQGSGTVMTPSQMATLMSDDEQSTTSNASMTIDGVSTTLSGIASVEVNARSKDINNNNHGRRDNTAPSISMDISGAEPEAATKHYLNESSAAERRAKFSMFIASGKRLGSFAREYLHHHGGTSGVPMDPRIVGHSKSTHAMLNSSKVNADVVQSTKHPMNPRQFGHNRSSGGSFVRRMSSTLSEKDEDNGGVTSTGTGAADVEGLLSQGLKGKSWSKSKGKTSNRPQQQSNRSQPHYHPAAGLGDTGSLSSSPLASVTGSEAGAGAGNKMEMDDEMISHADMSAASERGNEEEGGGGGGGAAGGDDENAEPLDASEDAISHLFSIKDVQLSSFDKELTTELLLENRLSSKGKKSASSKKKQQELLKRGRSREVNLSTPQGTSGHPSLGSRGDFMRMDTAGEPPNERVVRTPGISLKSRLNTAENTAAGAAVAAMETNTTAGAAATAAADPLKTFSQADATSAPSTADTAVSNPKVTIAITRSNTFNENLIEDPDVAPLLQAPHSPTPKNIIFAKYDEAAPSNANGGSIGGRTSDNGGAGPTLHMVNFPFFSDAVDHKQQQPQQPAQQHPHTLQRRNTGDDSIVSQQSSHPDDLSVDSLQHMQSMQSVYNEYGHSMNISAAQQHLDPQQLEQALLDEAHRNGVEYINNVPYDEYFSDSMSSPMYSRNPSRGGMHTHSLATADGLTGSGKQKLNNKKRKKKLFGHNGHPHPSLLAAGSSSMLSSSGSMMMDMMMSSSPEQRRKRGTNHAIVHPSTYPVKAEPKSFPQGIYFGVVKNALDIRDKPNYNPSWDHTRALKHVRLAALQQQQSREKELHLALTTAPISVAGARKLHSVIRKDEHGKRIINGIVPPHAVHAPVRTHKVPPLVINIATSSSSSMDEGEGRDGNGAAGSTVNAGGGTRGGSGRLTTGGALDAMSSMESSLSGTVSAASGSHSQKIPAAGKLTSGPQLAEEVDIADIAEQQQVSRPITNASASADDDRSHQSSSRRRRAGSDDSIDSLGSATAGAASGQQHSIPVPDVLFQSYVQLESPQKQAAGTGTGTGTGSGAGAGSGTAGGGGRSRADDDDDVSVGSMGSTMSVPSLLIKPVSVNPHSTSPLNRKPKRNTTGVATASGGSHSPAKMYIDTKGKLQGTNVKVKENIFEIHHKIDEVKASGVPLVMQFAQPPSGTAPLVPFKHPYLVMNGMTHILPDDMKNTMKRMQYIQQQSQETRKARPTPLPTVVPVDGKPFVSLAGSAEHAVSNPARTSAGSTSNIGSTGNTGNTGNTGSIATRGGGDGAKRDNEIAVVPSASNPSEGGTNQGLGMNNHTTTNAPEVGIEPAFLGGSSEFQLSSLYETAASSAVDLVTESVYLGNSSSVTIKEGSINPRGPGSSLAMSMSLSALPANAPASTIIPWLPRGTLEPLEHDRSNHIIGLREKHTLMKHYPEMAAKQLVTIRSQHAIREAFENFAHNQHEIQLQQSEIQQKLQLQIQYLQQQEQQQVQQVATASGVTPDIAT